MRQDSSPCQHSQHIQPRMRNVIRSWKNCTTIYFTDIFYSKLLCAEVASCTAYLLIYSIIWYIFWQTEQNLAAMPWTSKDSNGSVKMPRCWSKSAWTHAFIDVELWMYTGLLNVWKKPLRKALYVRTNPVNEPICSISYNLAAFFVQGS